MTAAVRQLPDSTNGSPPYDALTWQQLGNNEIKALWQVATTRLTSVSGTNDLTAASDSSLVAAIPAYAQPMSFWLIPANTNTGAMTLNIDGVGAVYLRDKTAAVLAGGVIVAGTSYLIVYDGSGFRVHGSGSGTGVSNPAPDMILRDEKTSGTLAGGFTSGSFATRTLNTAVRNVLPGATLASNQFTLQPGTYLIEWWAPALQVGFHQTRLFNATDSTTVETGTSAVANTGAAYSQAPSFGKAVVTITSAKAFEIDHICQTTKTTNGLGAATSIAAKEVYTWVNVWQVGSVPSPSPALLAANYAWTGSHTFSQGISLTGVNSGIELGSTGSLNTPYVDFHSSGNNIDYDVRLIAGGGTGSSGNGSLTLVAASLILSGVSVSYTAPSTKTANYSQAAADYSLIFNGSGSLTLTLLSASAWSGKTLQVKTVANQTVLSASSNVVPLAGGSAGTAILSGAAGKWATLESDGTNWIIIAGN